MIVRIVRGRLAPGRLDEAHRALAATGPLRGEWPSGLVRAHAWLRIDDGLREIVWLDFVSTPDGSTTAEGSTAASRLLAPILDELQVAHFELEEPVVRESAADAAILRLTVGRFSERGSDIQAQDLLRQRLASVGPEMIEAYVGRRIVGRAIEVAFASLWTGAPADRALDEPLWPDITIHYDTYHLGLYRPLEGGP